MRTKIIVLVLLTLILATPEALPDEILQNRYANDQSEPRVPVLLAQADAKKDSGQDSAEGQLSEQCVKFARDPDADLGEVIRAGCQPTIGQMSALMDNPLGNVAMLFTQFDYYRLENQENGREADLGVYTGIFQFPKKLNDDWNLISRVIWTVSSMPVDQDDIDDFDFGSGPGGAPKPPSGSPPAPIDLFDGRTTGLGDSYYVGLFAPSKGIPAGDGQFLWGAGFDIGFPTASEDVLGTGRWAAGPSALAVYMGPTWKIGALGMHYWDFAGDNDRSDVNLTNLQYFVYYSLDDVTSIGASPNIIVDWEQEDDNRLTLPVGIGINRTFQFGKVPVRIGLEFHYSAIQPDDIPATKYGIRFFIIPAAPSALFSWMQ